jgi:hypothetical protein
MGTTFVGLRNLADVADFLGISSEDPVFSRVNLLDDQLSRVTRTLSNSSAVSITVLFDAITDIDYICLPGTNLTSNATLRLRGSNSDPFVGSSLVFDTGTFDAGVSDDYRILSYLTGATVSARYFRITIDDDETEEDYLEFGRLGMGPALRAPRRHSMGYLDGPVSLSERDRAQNGHTWTYRQPVLRQIQFQMPYLTAASRDDGYRMLQAYAADRDATVACLDSAAAGTKTVWGVIDQLAPLRNFYEDDDTELFTLEISITEQR